MKTSKLAFVLLLAFLLQATFASRFLVAEPSIPDEKAADLSKSGVAENSGAKGPKDPDAVNAAKKIKDGFLELAGGSCFQKSEDICKPAIPDLNIKGSPEIAE